MLLFQLWCISVLALLAATVDPPKVKTSLGKIIGSYYKSRNSRLYAAYEGVPYALPPENEFRFKDPVPITTPFGHLNATSKSSHCPQLFEGSLFGSEDCLYMNIYVPVLKDDSKRMPVIFFIHGGSFQVASGSLFGEKYLADRDVVFITINYRLGVLGFLSTEDKVLPGNLGLKDQNLALRWVSENIEFFGGDPKRVILVGFSAGSASVQYHYLSPMSRGLFHGSIGMSGSAFNSWGFASHSAEKAKKLGAMFNCSTENSLDMIDCLKKVPALELAAANEKFKYWQQNPEAPWAPVVDRYSENPFISLSPRDLFDGKLLYDVPAVFGVVQDEGCDPVSGYSVREDLLKELNDRWVEIAPHLLDINYTVPNELHQKVALEARSFYFGNNIIDVSTIPQLIQMVTDQNYFIGIENGVRLQAKASQSPVYLYYYAYRGSKSYSDHLTGTHNNYGVCHGDDTNLIVPSFVDPTRTEEDNNMAEFLMDMLVSVAYNGTPNVGVTWDPVDASNKKLKFLKIYGPGNYSMSGDYDFGRKSFWSKFVYTVQQ